MTVLLLSLLKSDKTKRHEEYLYYWGHDVTIYLGDNNEYPKSLKDYIAWRVNTTSGEPNQVIESLLQLCVCPLTKHKPQILDGVDDWADIKIAPHLSVFLPGEVMLAYCPATNHKDNKCCVVIHRPIGLNATSWKQHYLIKSMSQEAFGKKLEEQRLAFEAIVKP